jgi:hypothetical protein
MSVVWIEESVVLALYEEHLAEHGGPVGIRDRGLLESALLRPQNLIGTVIQISLLLPPMALALPVTIHLSTATNAQLSQ